MVIGFDPQEQFAELLDLEILLTDEGEDWENEKVLKYRGALIVWDDYYLLHSKNQASKGLKAIMAFRAKYDYDIIYITHNPSLILNLFTYFTSYYYIFLTNVVEGGFKAKIPCYSLCESASKLINRYVKKHGKGEYPDFPHIVVDTQNMKLIAQNCNKEFLEEVANTGKN